MVAAVLWLALMTTYSQSSFIALIAGPATLIALRWSLKWVLAGLVALAVGVIPSAPSPAAWSNDLGAINKQTSGRANLVEGGMDLFEASRSMATGPVPSRLPSSGRWPDRTRR